MIKHFDKNEIGRDFVVGDIHGMYDFFFKCLKELEFDADVDRMFSVGDLADRGPNSMYSLMLSHLPWFHAVKGNHEDMFVNTLNQKWDYSNFILNGGGWVVSEDPDQISLLADHVETLPLVISVGTGEDRFNIVHAELYNNESGKCPIDLDLDYWNFDEYNEINMMWGRNFFELRNTGDLIKMSKELSTTYVGHSILENPIKIGHHVYIDGGAMMHHLYRHSTSVQRDRAKLIFAEPNNKLIHAFTVSDECYKKYKLEELQYIEPTWV